MYRLELTEDLNKVILKNKLLGLTSCDDYLLLDDGNTVVLRNDNLKLNLINLDTNEKRTCSVLEISRLDIKYGNPSGIFIVNSYHTSLQYIPSLVVLLDLNKAPLDKLTFALSINLSNDWIYNLNLRLHITKIKGYIVLGDSLFYNGKRILGGDFPSFNQVKSINLETEEIVIRNVTPCIDKTYKKGVLIDRNFYVNTQL